MAQPDLKNYTSHVRFGKGLVLTGTSEENILGNLAGSGKVIMATITVTKRSGTSSSYFTLTKKDQDGVPIFSNAGATGATVGTDTVAGSELWSQAVHEVPYRGSIVVQRITLEEDQSITITASGANELSVAIDYDVMG